MENNCFVTNLKAIVDISRPVYFDGVTIKVLDAEKAIAGSSGFTMTGASDIIGCTLTNNRISSISKPNIAILGKSNLTVFRCMLSNQHGQFMHSLEVDLNTCGYMPLVERIILQYMKVKGDLSKAFLGGNGNILGFDFGGVDFSEVTNDFDDDGLVFGNYLTDDAFSNLHDINIQGPTVPILEMMPFINACRTRGRFPSSYNDGINLAYSQAILIKINGNNPNASVRYISWTVNTVLLYNNEGTLLETLNI